MSSPNPPGWVSTVGRIGYGAKGAVYAVVGVLAGMAAAGQGGEMTGSKGAIQKIGQQPLGQVMLVLLVIGLACYALWRFLGAFLDAEGNGTDAKGIATRIGYFFAGVIHVGLAWAAFEAIGGGGSGESDAQGWTAKLMGMPFGPWLVMGAGVIVAIVGFVQWKHALTGDYREKFDLDGAAAAQREWIERAAKLGLGARGLVFVLAGVFLVQAGWQVDAGEVRGLGGTLTELAQQPYGPWLLGLTALGLFCYGVYCEVIAGYGRIGGG